MAFMQKIYRLVVKNRFKDVFIITEIGCSYLLDCMLYATSNDKIYGVAAYIDVVSLWKLSSHLRLSPSSPLLTKYDFANPIVFPLSMSFCFHFISICCNESQPEIRAPSMKGSWKISL